MTQKHRNDSDIANYADRFELPEVLIEDEDEDDCEPEPVECNVDEGRISEEAWGDSDASESEFMPAQTRVHGHAHDPDAKESILHHLERQRIQDAMSAVNEETLTSLCIIDDQIVELGDSASVLGQLGYHFIRDLSKRKITNFQSAAYRLIPIIKEVRTVEGYINGIKTHWANLGTAPTTDSRTRHQQMEECDRQEVKRARAAMLPAWLAYVEMVSEVCSYGQVNSCARQN